MLGAGNAACHEHHQITHPGTARSAFPAVISYLQQYQSIRHSPNCIRLQHPTSALSAIFPPPQLQKPYTKHRSGTCSAYFPLKSCCPTPYFRVSKPHSAVQSAHQRVPAVAAAHTPEQPQCSKPQNRCKPWTPCGCLQHHCLPAASAAAQANSHELVKHPSLIAPLPPMAITASAAIPAVAAQSAHAMQCSVLQSLILPSPPAPAIPKPAITRYPTPATF
jgi:hypothetical protein